MIATRYQWVIRAAILLLVATVLAIGLIANGVFDPSPVGTLQWQLQDRQLAVAPQSRDIIWMEEAAPHSAITVRMTGALQSGEEDSGYGLVFGDEENYLAVAVSPLGYLAIWESELRSGKTEDSYLLQWQTWPHVRRAHDSNEIWVDIAGDRATVRINREWLWEGEIGSKSPRVGLLGESFVDSALFDFMSVELFGSAAGDGDG